MRIFILVVLSLAMIAPAYGQFLGPVKNILNKAQGDAENQMNEAVNNNDGPKKDDSAPTNAPPVNPNGNVVAQWVTTNASDGTPVRLYVARDENNTANTLPGLLVVQEWWGVNKDIQNRTKEFAARGAVAVAVDLYGGKVTEDPKEAASWRAALTDDNALLRMKTALNFMSDPKNGLRIQQERLGAIGWCMGGEEALKLAVRDSRVRALAVFYGPLILDSTVLHNINGPVLGIFGNDDTHPSPADVNSWEQTLKAVPVPVTVYRYDGAGHAFASESAKPLGLYREVQAKDAWAKTWAWLNDNVYRKKF